VVDRWWDFAYNYIHQRDATKENNMETRNFETANVEAVMIKYSKGNVEFGKGFYAVDGVKVIMSFDQATELKSVLKNMANG
jgi:hypothetical protein